MGHWFESSPGSQYKQAVIHTRRINPNFSPYYQLTKTCELIRKYYKNAIL